MQRDSGRRACGICIVGNQVAAADFHPVDACGHRRLVEQAIADNYPHGVAHGTILRCRHHVLKNYRCFGPEIFDVVGTACYIQNLVGLDAAGPGIC